MLDLRASRASESFARLFKGGLRAGAEPLPALRRARNSLYAHKRSGRGSKGETLSRGFPLLSLRLYVCAVTLGGFRYPALRFDPISLVLAQRNGVEPPKKSAFLPRRLHHSRERYCFGGRYVPRPTWVGGGWLSGRSSQLDAVGGDVGASSPWERWAGPNSCRGGTHKRVSLGLHPVSLRKSKEMGWNGQQGQCGLLPNKTAHT